MTDTPAPVGSLWIGGYLSFLERICLKSYVDAGQPFTLYTYEPIDDVPEGIEVRDAREVYPETNIMMHTAKRSPAIHSDIFRVKMIAQTGKIWADLDAYCVKPLKPTNGYLFGWLSKFRIGSGVLALPQDSPALAGLDAYLATGGALPPWWDEQRQADYLEAGEPLEFSAMKWGTTGPLALTHFLRESGEIEHASPPEVLYPIPPNLKFYFHRRPLHIHRAIKENTQSVHLYATGLRVRLEDGPPRNGSYIDVLAREHGVSPLEYPVRPRPKRDAVDTEPSAD
ncbi:hypothetical protein [Pontivivens insulae]|uniref:Alpha 1,4-glycosyltransferase domain-containing protein n=1 Tax=Pontivivens insulae TaxID=1639689 RepID=A0A2R8A7Y3_9RHOB|nr:hypothetical protein [Pontivivens insulae]RED18424.1 hypothetical protein DFR53_0619 [Pontivivens insulae]SPF28322.1 hypothetical protein POI8812_00620 [Pontivivens insulae]